ncbi:hypothetical protein C8024_15560 [Sphingopyxis sp. BSNA05]|nr:hypothetical protein [Sphingopyxis sp. BSNA05]
MAEWAFWLLVLTGLGLAVTIAGTIGLYWQIMLTREAVEDTGEATDEMRESNRIARHTSEIQLRAYVDIDSVHYSSSDLMPSEGTKTGTGLTVIIKNYGVTPAHGAYMVIDSHIATKDGDMILRMKRDESDFSVAPPNDIAIKNIFHRLDNEIWEK